MTKFLARTALVVAALIYALPFIKGVRFHGDLLSALKASLVFNAIFLLIEWLLAVVVLGINIGTLGLGVLLAQAFKFFATLLAPSVALCGTAHVFPKWLHVYSYFPGAIIAGVVIGGLFWVWTPGSSEGKRRW